MKLDQHSLCNKPCWQPIQDPPSLLCCSIPGKEWQRLRGELSCERKERFRQRSIWIGSHYWHYMSSTSEAVWVLDTSQTATASAPTCAKCPHQSLLLQYCCPLHLVFQCWDRRKQTLKRNSTSLTTTFRDLATTWEQTPPPIGQWWPLTRGKALFHTWIQP